MWWFLHFHWNCLSAVDTLIQRGLGKILGEGPQSKSPFGMLEFDSTKGQKVGAGQHPCWLGKNAKYPRDERRQKAFGSFCVRAHLGKVLPHFYL